MTRDEKVARAIELREQGVFVQEIGTYLGVAKSTIVRWTTPGAHERSIACSRRWKLEHREEHLAYQHRYDAEHKGSCEHCGGECRRGAVACDGCVRATCDVRRSLVEGMWADGWRRGEINAVLGVAPDSSYIFVRRAHDGWDLPHRRSPEALANIRAGNPRLR